MVAAAKDGAGTRGKGGTATTSPAQCRYIRRLLSQAVEDVGFRGAAAATFTTERQALLYVASRTIPIPSRGREASRMIEAMKDDPEGGLRGLVNRHTPGMLSLRREVQQTLREAAGYPQEGWLERLNALVRKRTERMLMADESDSFTVSPGAYRECCVDAVLPGVFKRRSQRQGDPAGGSAQEGAAR